MPQYVTFYQLAEELSVDASTIRRNSRRLKLEIRREKTPTSRGMMVNCLTREDADKLRAFFESRARPEELNGTDSEAILQRFGHFYVIQLVPEALPNRVKIGFTDNLRQRLHDHQTSAPTARLIKSWPCKRSWDQAAMDAIAREDCCLVMNEVYEGDVDGFIKRGEEFFRQLPSQETAVRLSEHSPLTKKTTGKKRITTGSS